MKVNNLTIVGVNGDCSFTSEDVKEMYNHLVSLFHQSQMNGLVNIDTYDRIQLKKLLKLPTNYR